MVDKYILLLYNIYVIIKERSRRILKYCVIIIIICIYWILKDCENSGWWLWALVEVLFGGKLYWMGIYALLCLGIYAGVIVAVLVFIFYWSLIFWVMYILWFFIEDEGKR